VSSWLVEGFADKLVDIDHSNIYWIIVPIINVDGVTLGNNRTGMLGFDFNRHWYID
jgi:murein tripeptide amidase MpaA